jgi:hypothetical protein
MMRSTSGFQFSTKMNKESRPNQLWANEGSEYRFFIRDLFAFEKHNSTICMETWANGHRISTAPIPPVQSLILRDRLWAHFGSIGAVAMIRSTTIAAQPDR